MRIASSLVLLAGLSSFVVGCGPSPGALFGKPSSVTDESALSDIGKGLNQLNAEAHKGQTANDHRSFGMSLDEVSVTFNVSATADRNGKLTIDLNAAPPAVPGVTAKAGAELGGSNQATRGNTITLKFKNPIYAGPDTLISKVPAADLGKILTEISRQQIVPAPLGGVGNPAEDGGPGPNDH